MTQDNRYVDGGEPVVAQRVVTETEYVTPAPVVQTYAPVAETVVRKAHPGLIPLALSSLLGLLSLFLPFAVLRQAWTHPGSNVAYTANHAFNFFGLGNGHHIPTLLALLGAALLGLIGYATRAVWARYLAGILGLLSGLYLLWHAFRSFGAASFGHFFGSGFDFAQGLTHGWGRWIMALAGLALLATALWSLLRGAGDDVADTAAGAYNAATR